MSNLELLPVPSSLEGRTLVEVDDKLEEGTHDVIVYDGTTAYPNINIDPRQIIKPTVVKSKFSTDFIVQPQSIWKKALNFIRSYQFMSAFTLIANLQYKTLNECLTLTEKVKSIIQLSIQKMAQGIVWIHDQLIKIYSSFYPYAMLPPEEMGQIFSQALDWQNGVIRSFRWHPTALKAALALSNDDVFIYSSSDTIVLLLRHPFQKNIIDIIWNPKIETEVAVVCQGVIVIWSVKTDPSNEKSRIPLSNAILIEKEVKKLYPITSVIYDPTGTQLFVSSPSSSKVLILDHPNCPSPPAATSSLVSSPISPNFKSPQVKNVTLIKKEETKEKVEFIRKWGQGVHRLIFSPNGSRLLTLPASNCIRVYEKLAWSSRKWGSQHMSDLCQCAVWSKPLGHYLLVAPRKDPSIYAVAFYDQPLAGEVGGESTFMKVLDLSEYELPNGQMVGGAIHNMAWDKNSARLVIAFEENSEYLAVFKTSVRSILEIEPLGYIHGNPGEKPLAMDFHDSFKKGSLLTICWSSGFISHLPFQYELQSTVHKNRSLDVSRVRNVSTTSTPRNLTSYCRSPLLSSPLPSPIATPSRHHGTPNESLNLTPSTSSTHVTKHFLSSDSVITPRKPTLFSKMATSQLTS